MQQERLGPKEILIRLITAGRCRLLWFGINCGTSCSAPLSRVHRARSLPPSARTNKFLSRDSLGFELQTFVKGVLCPEKGVLVKLLVFSWRNIPKSYSFSPSLGETRGCSVPFVTWLCSFYYIFKVQAIFFLPLEAGSAEPSPWDLPSDQLMALGVLIWVQPYSDTTQTLPTYYYSRLLACNQCC